MKTPAKTMADVVLVYPVTGLDLKGVSVWLPLSVLSVAAALTDAYDVAVVDQRTDPDWEESLKRAVTSDTLCVGISSMTGTQIRWGLKAAKVVRDLAPELPIVWGGNHPTLMPEQTARHPLVDAVVMGEGEGTFRRLVDALKEGRGWRACANIVYKADGGVRRQGTPYEFVDPSELPELPYQLVDVEKYVQGRLMFGKPARSLPFISSFGCPYECTFCCQPVLSKRRWRRMDPETVYRRTSALAQRYRLDAVEFHDEEFFVDRRRGAQIAERIGGAFAWYAQTRMDDLLALDLPRLEKQGLHSLQPGLESGSERILSLIKKGETVAEYRKANEALKDTSIQTTYNFMMGFPTETREDLYATMDLALELIDANPNAQVSAFYVFVPYPGSELFDLAVANGFVPPENLEGWSAFHRHSVSSPWLPNKSLVEFLMMTSKFIDGRRLRLSLDGLGGPAGAAIPYLSRRYRERWRRHDLGMTWDAKILSLLARRVFSW